MLENWEHCKLKKKVEKSAVYVVITNVAEIEHTPVPQMLFPSSKKKKNKK